MMTTANHETVQEWLQLQLDGELPTLYRHQLATHLEDCAACRRQAERLETLERTLADTRVPVVEGFEQRVMDGLPGAAWETRRPQAWIAAMATLALLLGGAVSLVAISGISRDLGLLGTFASMLERTVLAGTGLLTASWRGLGLALADLWSTSPLSGIVLGLLVVALNLVLWRGVRGRTKRGAAARTPSNRRR
jgi:anti-sigma factor RsiW